MRTRGLTIVELMVAMAITGVVMTATSQVMMASQDAITVAALESELSALVLNACDRVANDVKDAVASSVAVGSVNGGTNNQISFQKCMGYGASGLLLDANVIVYEEVTYATGRTCIVRRYNGTVESLTDSLLPGSFKFTRNTAATVGAVYNVAMTLQKPVIPRLAKKLDLAKRADCTDNYFALARQTSIQLKF